MADDLPTQQFTDCVVVHSGARPLPMSVLAFGDPNRPVDVVWLHANGLNAATYRDMLSPLGEHLRVLAIDQRGHGGTPQLCDIADKRDAYDLRDDLLALLEIVAADRPVILAGHSLGGCVSLLAAAEAPARVRGMALFDPVVLSQATEAALIQAGGRMLPESGLAAKARSRRNDFPSREAALANYKGRAIFTTWPDAAVEGYVEAGFRDLPGGGGVELSCAPAWEAANFTAHGHDSWEAMARIEAPIIIHRAEHGSTCSISTAAEFPRPAGQVEVITVAGATHFLPIEKPELVRQVLRERADLWRGAA
jgi:pimeloyl-ACP methyl ester carboxylesterase